MIECGAAARRRNVSSRRLHPSLLLGAAFALAACGRPAPPDLLLLVTVDTLRADHLGAHGSTLGATPNLDRLAAESTVFATAYAPVAHTLPSVAALMSGRYPEEIGVVNNDSALAEGVPTLAAALRSAGYRTHAVVSNWVLRRSSGLAAGFDVYDDVLPQLEATRPLPERIAKDTTDAALREIAACRAQGGARCFVWIHYQDPHGPYTPPDGFRERFLARERAAPDGGRLLPVLSGIVGMGGIPAYQAIGGEREAAFYRAGYSGEVAYLDQEIGRLLAGLGDARERALIAFAADHGEGLGENDYWFAHGEYLSDALVRVPIWLRIPGAKPARRDDVATLLDLHATLRALAGASAAEPPARGRDLLAKGASEAASTPFLATLGGSDEKKYGWIENGYKCVLTFRGGTWRGQLFRLGDDAVDLAAPAPQIASALRNRLADFSEQLPRPAPVTRPAISEEDRERLRALGYEVHAPAAPTAPLR
jgi:arylsulfatase A-like enzyme